MTSTVEAPAILGGPKCVVDQDPTLFQWPIVTAEDEQAVLGVLRAGSMSGIDITLQFEAEFAAWQGSKHALCCCNGTAALLAAMFGVGVGAGDEIIGPAMTYWASLLPALQLRATPVVADIDPHTFCINPDDLARRITPRTKAVVVVHQFGHPCDMDRIMPIIRKHGLKLIEDLSHAQGGLYKGKRLGSFGDVAAMSMMSAKSFAIGEGGMLITNDRSIFERAMAFGHYERTNPQRGFITDPGLQQLAGMPLGGVKHRINQVASAMGRVQLKYYDARCAEIRRAMNRFWDLLEGCPGLRAHRVDEADGSTMAGWYCPVGVYAP
ncbi:MAG TPA: DegT/DnrJ/EryC1/StrS family aminotransferase, partial [Planctomycetota bacterium]|nr:DegT/DnrJ/EryC1/StrS family aminotransferase [Planctomycetota bacterium]